MQILSIIPNSKTFVTGRMSDGSDHQTVTVIEYEVTVSDAGSRFTATLQSDNPQDIADAYEGGIFTLIEPTQNELQMQTLLNTEYLVVMSELTNL